MPLDAFLRIRSQLESQSSPKCLLETDRQHEAKVIARNRECYVTERPDKSILDYERRARHHHTGFASLAHVPYRPFAGLKHTDPYSLIADTMGLPFQQTDHIRQSASDSHKECTKSTSLANQQTIRVVRECGGGKKFKVHSRTAGLSAIRLHVGSTTRAVREVTAGAAYLHTVPREEERRSFLVKMRAPKYPNDKPTDDSDNQHSIHNPSIFLPLLVHTASSKGCLTSKRPKMNSHTSPDNKRLTSYDEMEGEGEEEKDGGGHPCTRVGPNIYVAVAAAHFKLHFGQPGRKKMSPTKKLQMRKCLVKLKAIYSILCCLYNMKTRELKNKRPLTMVSIKQMSVKPLPNKEGPHHHAHRLGAHTHTYHTHTPSHHLQPYRQAGHSIETWEDLMLATRPPGHSTSDTLSPQLRGTSAHLDPQQKMARVLPPWQRQLVFVENSDENSNCDPATEIAECINGFQSARDQISEQTESLLRRRQKSSTRLLGVKARELRLGADSESCLREMREKAYRISRNERALEKNRPAWFGQLEREVASAFESHTSSSCSDQLQSSQRGVAKCLLEKMKYFLYSDIDTIPRVIEKLCLLMMSLPSDQLCLTPVIAAVQKAILYHPQFVLEHILEVPARVCQQWLEMRGVPATGVPLTPQPVIVFGLTV